MNFNYKNILILVLIGFSLASPKLLQAATSPLSVNVVPPVQFPSSDFDVAGVRFSLLWGSHRDVRGFDFGLVGNVTNQRFGGMSASGLFNITRGTTTALGLQLAGLANVNSNKTSVYGLQLAGGINWNDAASRIVGLQIAALGNISPHTDIYGLQIGLYNTANEVYGFQLGLINRAKSLHGIQIGLINFNYDGIFEVSPILNVGF